MHRLARVARAIRRHRRARALAVAISIMLVIGPALHVFGSSVARSQSAGANGLGEALQVGGPPITPPPDPCAAQPSGSCPSCTTNVPGASDYENSLPVPSPAPGFNYVVQLVNESDVTILAAANAANQGSATPGGQVPPPVAVEPREKTWVMLPKGAPNNGNILTIDVPMEWEGTQCPQTNTSCGANGPRFFPRTGCKVDIDHNLAQCETGSCGDAYDCGQQALRNPPLASSGRAPVSIVEWTFNSQGGQGFDYPDISLVDGVSITVDVQALGPHCESKPGAPTEPNWLSQNQPLAIHGADLREADRCIPSFRLTRGEVGQVIQGGGDNPDDVVGCFTNCGRYEYPKTPDVGCDPTTDERCKDWLAFCCFAPPGDPNHVYGGPCTSDDQCAQHGGCWDTGSGSPMCACRAFLKDPDCPPDVCTHPYSPSDKSAQPPFGTCADVTTDATACIGDDTVHQVFPGGYTWPNDPQTYLSDARAYRIIFAPGGTTVPITDSGDIPLCESLPSTYGYDVQSQVCSGNITAGALFAGAAPSPDCMTNDDCPIIPGSTPPAHYGCDPLHKRCSTWGCDVADGGPVPIGGLLCRWTAGASPTPTATPRRLGATPPPAGTPTATPKSGSNGGCAIDPNGSGANGGTLLGLFVAGILLVVRRRIR